MDTQNISQEKRMLAGTAISLGAQIAGFILYLFAVRTILSGLSKDENGMLFGIQNLCAMILALVVEAGMNTIVLRKIVQDEKNYAVIIATFAKMRILLWLVGLIIVTVGGAILIPGNTALLALWAVYLLIGSKSALWRFVFELRYRANMDLLPVYLLGLLDTVLFLGVVKFLPEPLSAMSIVIGFCVSSIPSFVILVLMTGDWKLLSTPFSKPIAKDIIKSSVPVMLAYFMMQIHDKSDAFFLGYFTNKTELGIFGAVYRILPPLLAVSAAISTVFTPVIARLHIEDPERCNLYLVRGIKILLFAGGLISVILSGSTSLIIEVLTEGVYADSYAQFFVFLWLPIPMYIVIFVLDMNIILGLQRNNFIITAVEAGLSILTNIMLTPFFASLGTVFSKLITLIISAFIALWLLKTFVFKNLTFSFFMRFSGAALTGAICSYYLPKLMPELLASALSALIYVTMMMLLKAIESEDLTLLRQYLRKIGF